MTGDSRGRTMAAEIEQQPEVLRRLAKARPAILACVAGLVGVERSRPRPVALLGRGSSANAGALGRAFLEAAGLPVTMLDVDQLDAATAPAYRDHVVVALSQSGRGEEAVAALESLRSAGAQTIAVTNDARSPLALTADAHIDLEAGVERAVPATKTFLAQVTVLSFVAEALAGPGDPPVEPLDVGMIADALDRDLADRAPVEAAAARLAVDGPDGGLVVGLGPLAAVAAEVALKLMETTGTPWAARSSAEVLHGPVAVLRPGRAVVALTGDDRAGQETDALLPRLAARGSAVLRIGGVSSGADVPTSVGVQPALSFLAVVRGQDLARLLALHLGVDPDQPHGLSKVTTTSVGP